MYTCSTQVENYSPVFDEEGVEVEGVEVEGVELEGVSL